MSKALIEILKDNSRIRLAVLSRNWNSLCRALLPDDDLRAGGRHPEAERIRTALRGGNPGLDKLARMAELLGCEPHQLLDPNWNGQE